MVTQPNILIIGGASVDRLRAGGSAVTTPGGGALYTALAAHKSGGEVRFFGYRPSPLPELFAEAASAVDWQGPPCLLSEIPHFEIVYDAQGDARMESASWGIEDTLDPQMLPDALLEGVEYIHLAAIHDASLQMAFVEHLRPRTRARISAGTFGYMVHRSPDAVRALMDACDLFFLNRFEAESVFGSLTPQVRAGQILVVTRGAEGADVWQGDWCTRVPPCPTTPVDLTGAGDSVCGGTLARLAAGLHPTEAVRLGAAAASVTIEAPGMQALLAIARDEPLRPGDVLGMRAHARGVVSDRLRPLRDQRVQLDHAQLQRFADLLRGHEGVRPFDFAGRFFPPVGDSRTLDWLFATCKHQFGFWTPYNGVWQSATYARWQGERLKGSDYCFAAMHRVLQHKPEQLTATGHARLRWQDVEQWFRDDDNKIPMPVLANHVQLAQQYGRDLWQLGWEPAELVREASQQPRPVTWLLQRLDLLPGYREDPLRKKSMLLVVALLNRPEHFLQASDAELAPIIDYHLMRSCLRTGLVRVVDAELDQRLRERRLLTPAEEWAVRVACYHAIRELAELSGRSLAAIDWFFFGARRRCPEETEPECRACPVDGVCDHQTGLFQPVLRTTAY